MYELEMFIIRSEFFYYEIIIGIIFIDISFESIR